MESEEVESEEVESEEVESELIFGGHLKRRLNHRRLIQKSKSVIG